MLEILNLDLCLNLEIFRSSITELIKRMILVKFLVFFNESIIYFKKVEGGNSEP